MKSIVLLLNVCALMPCLAANIVPPAPPPKVGALRIKPSEARSVAFVKYRDPSGYFTADVPRGWMVKVGMKPAGKVDLISYAITVFDPKCPERELYFCLNSAMGLQSVDARNW